MDIVERLRKEYEAIGCSLDADAADEIEKLRQQLADQIARNKAMSDVHWKEMVKLKDELASCIEDLDREVRVGNDYMSQLAKFERADEEHDRIARDAADARRKLATVTKERDELVAAAQAVVERWDSPLWKDVPHTATYINALRSALAKLGADKTGEK